MSEPLVTFFEKAIFHSLFLRRLAVDPAYDPNNWAYFKQRGAAYGLFCIISESARRPCISSNIVDSPFLWLHFSSSPSHHSGV